MRTHLLLFLILMGVLQPAFSLSKEQMDEFKASATLFQNKYYKSNVWDVFRSPATPTAGQPWTLSQFSEPYDAMTKKTIDWGAKGNRYLAFDLVNTNSGIYTDDIFKTAQKLDVVVKLYEADGKFVKDICHYAYFMGFGDKGFMIEMDNFYGTFFANDTYTKNARVTYTPTTGTLNKLSQLGSYKYSPPLVKPTAPTRTFVYNGTQQGLSIAPNPSYTIEGTVSATNVGQYSVTIKLIDKTNNKWSDDTTDDITFNWIITKAEYDLTNVRWVYAEPFTYDGTEKTVYLTGLPAGLTVDTYYGNKHSEVGRYTASVIFDYDKTNYNDPDFQFKLFSWEIISSDVTKPIVTNDTFTYNGTAQGPAIPINSLYTLNGTTSATNAGIYTIIISLNDKAFTKWTDGTNDDISVVWIIKKADYNMIDTHWAYSPDNRYVYNGQEKSVILVGLPEGVTVSKYEGNTATQTGTYTAKAILAYDNNNNFNEPFIEDLNWEIMAATVQKPQVKEPTFLYNGMVQGVTIAPSEYYSVSGTTSAQKAGEYSAAISLIDKTNNIWNDATTDDIVLNWRILKADYDMTSAQWDYFSPIDWDGTEKTVTLVGLPEGVTVSKYEGNKGTQPGGYHAIATLAYDNDNYNEPIVSSLHWIIAKSYNNLSIIKLWDNVLAVSNENKYEEIRNASFKWYRNNELLNGTQQHIRFDNKIPAGNYKVMMTTADGTIIGLTFLVEGTMALKAYPNPLVSGNELTVETGMTDNESTAITVLDQSGQAVRVNISNTSEGIKISGLHAKGFYMIRLMRKGENPETVKILVQ